MSIIGKFFMKCFHYRRSLFWGYVLLITANIFAISIWQTELGSRIFNSENGLQLPRDSSGRGRFFLSHHRKRRKNPNEKLILVWGLLWAGKYFQNGKQKFEKCKYKNCRLTHDAKALDYSDAVVMEVQPRESEHCLTGTDMPPYRPDYEQLWIFYQQESAALPHISLGYHCLNNLINATMTTRRDSDIYSPLVVVGPRQNDKQTETRNTSTSTNLAFGKTKMVAWFVDHCQTPSKREIYVKELMQHIPVDVYGRCGFMNCDNYLTDCFKEMGKNYKFYLSFEDSICPDQVSGMLIRATRFNMVPVVLGGADYATILPKSAYIDVRDFESPQELALYLKEVDNNDGLYDNYRESYINWAKSNSLYLDDDHISECELCEYVNTVKNKKVYENVKDWFYKCTEPTQFYGKGISEDSLKNDKEIYFENSRDSKI